MYDFRRKESYCIKGYAEALEVIPYTLAENADLSLISVVTELCKDIQKERRMPALM